MRRYGLVDIPEDAEDINAVPISRTITINGTTYDLSANRSWTVSSSLTLTTTGSSGPATLVGSTLNIPDYSTSLTGYVPYTGATTSVNLGANSLTCHSLITNGLCTLFKSSVTGSNSYIIFEQDLTSTSWNGSSGFSSIAPYYNQGIALIVNSSGSNFKGIILRTDLMSASGAKSYYFPDSSGNLVISSDLTGRFLPKATPASPAAGQVYYDSTTNKLRCYNGTTWNDLF